ncbi:hypothetical protein FA013_04635 [Raoultella planticola]|nr:hypothetical protein FA013_04635 [Raoultella planticola]
MFAGKKSAQIREILISESAWEEMTCLFAPSLIQSTPTALLLIPMSGVLIICMQRLQRSSALAHQIRKVLS